MRGQTIQVRCPCCKERLTVDVDRRVAVQTDPSPLKADDPIQAALKNEADRARRATDAFERAKDDWSKGPSSLDDLLGGGGKSGPRKGGDGGSGGGS